MDLHHLLLAGLPAHSGLPPQADIIADRRLVSKCHSSHSHFGGEAARTAVERAAGLGWTLRQSAVNRAATMLLERWTATHASEPMRAAQDKTTTRLHGRLKPGLQSCLQRRAARRIAAHRSDPSPRCYLESRAIDHQAGVAELTGGPLPALIIASL